MNTSKALNQSQLHLLSMLSFAKTKTALFDLKDVLAQFYAKKVDEQMDELWKSGKMTHEKNENLKTKHLRTHYKKGEM